MPGCGNNDDTQGARIPPIAGIVALLLGLIVASQICSTLPARSAAGSPAPALYAADSVTTLFDDFEGSNRAARQSANVGYQPGYLSGQALYLPDTMSWAQYDDTWWVDNGNGFQESGTIEFYYRPDTAFLFTTDRSHAMLFTNGEREVQPGIGQPNLSILEEGKLDWAISRSPFGVTYNEIANDNPPLFPMQWYHIAVTWGQNVMRLFRNGTLVATGTEDAFVSTDTFLLGATGVLPFTQGLAARGRIDRLRLSSRPRGENELPSAMDVRIDSPVNGGTFAAPFPVTYRAFESIYRQRLVDIFADTDDRNFNGTPVARNLPESGTFLIGAGITAGSYVLYAIAHSGGDSAFYYVGQPITVTVNPSFGSIVDPMDTTGTVAVAPATIDTFTLILLNGGGATPAPLVNASTGATVADSSGTRANYSIASNLMLAADSVRIYVWTTETTPSILLGVRSDTSSLDSTFLPLGIANSALGRSALGATAFSLEFFRSNGTMIGDTASTRYVGDTFVYTIEYQLSKKTAGWFRSLGYDTAPGSGSFGFYFADTYGAAWRYDSSVTVSVLTGSAGGILVRVTGITRDLPGGLGLVQPGVVLHQVDIPGFCVIERLDPAEWMLELLRAFRDFLLSFNVGRWIAGCYYGV